MAKPFRPSEGITLCLGRECEHLARPVNIDVSDLISEFPEATLECVLIRPTESVPYPVSVSISEGVLTFWPTNSDTDKPGYGSGEVRATKDGKLLKSAKFVTFVNASIRGDGAVPPPGTDWVERTLTALGEHEADHVAHVTPEDRARWDAGGGAVWGSITGEIQNQTDLAEVFTAYSEEIDRKVTGDTAGVSSAMYALGFDSEPILDATQIVVQKNETTWVRRTADALWQWMRAKIFSAFVSVNPQDLTEEQQAQARANINVPLGGDRHLAQNASEGYISIASATSFATAYKCPCDGKVQIRKNGGTAYLHEDNYTIMSVTEGTTCSWVTQGAVVWHTGSPNAVNFIPYVKGALK